MILSILTKPGVSTCLTSGAADSKSSGTVGILTVLPRFTMVCP